MNMITRGTFALIRKPIKSLLAAAILYLISILLLLTAGLNRQQALVQEQMRSQIGGSLRLEVDRHAGFERLIPYMQEVYLKDSQAFTAYVDFQQAYHYNSISLEDIQTIGSLPGVSHYNVIAFPPLQVTPMDFENDRSQVRGRPQAVDELVTLHPVWNLELISETLQGFIRLEEGRYIGPEHKGASLLEVVISRDIAEANGLALGDFLTFSWSDPLDEDILDQIGANPLEEIRREARIVGIFEVSRSVNALNNGRTLENTIFAPFDMGEQFFAGTDFLERPRVMGAGERPEATFYVDDMDLYDQVREQILALDLDWERYNLIDANDLIASMGAGFQGLEQAGNLMFGIIIAVSFAMLLLVFALWTRNRTREAAIFLAIGIEKSNVLSQFIFEALLSGAIAFFLAVATLPLVQNFVDLGQLNQSLQSQEDFSWEDGSPSQMNHDSFFDSTTELVRDDMIELAASRIPLTFGMIGLVGGTVTLLITSSVLISAFPIIKQTPSQIFSKL